jgi:hypothetical protein
MNHVKTDEIYGKNDVVNANDFRRHLVNIDSRFRKTVIEPPTDFLYSFAHVYKNVIRARVASVEIPCGFFQFSTAKRNTMFRLDAMDYVGNSHFLTITIPDGDYTPMGLVEEVQLQFNAIRDTYGLFFRISMDPRSRRVTIIHDGSGPPPCPPGPSHCPVTFGLTFGMVGLEQRSFDFGLGYNLGFMNQYYVCDAPFSITSESLVNVEPDHYFLLAIDDFYTVEHKTNENYIQCLAKILIKKTPTGIIFDDGYTVLSNEIVFPRPIDLNQVRVRLLDKYGEPIDLHNLNFSLSLEISEVMNVQMYDNYRTYLWSKEEPKIVRSNTGSANSLSGRLYN